MKLFYSPGACSLSPHIVAREAGIDLKLQKVDTKTKTVAVAGDYWSVNPKGYVPALELDNGEILTEGPAIVQYLNRLSDLLFVIARMLNRAAGRPDVLWQQGKNR